jgi:hypothetical protein
LFVAVIRQSSFISVNEEKAKAREELQLQLTTLLSAGCTACLCAIGRTCATSSEYRESAHDAHIAILICPLLTTDAKSRRERYTALRGYFCEVIPQSAKPDWAGMCWGQEQHCARSSVVVCFFSARLRRPFRWSG